MSNSNDEPMNDAGDDEQAPTNKAAAIPIVRVLLNFTLFSSSVRVHTSPG